MRKGQELEDEFLKYFFGKGWNVIELGGHYTSESEISSKNIIFMHFILTVFSIDLKNQSKNQ